MNLSKIKIHEKILEKEIFFLNNKWPHFDLLFKGIKNISNLTKKTNKKVLMLERTNLYGGVSLFAPYFNQKNFISVDCITDNLKKRGSYNKKFLTNKNLIKIKSKYQYDYKKLKIKPNSIDYVIIPNLLHHIDDPILLFKQIKKILKSNGHLFIFEPLVRELHQIPEDYGRFTPFSLNKSLLRFGFKSVDIDFSGGPFSCILYYWDQALQYIPENKKKIITKRLGLNFKTLINLDKKFKKNLLRKNTSAPVSFSVLFKKK